MSDWVNLALLIRTQGRWGELLAEILTDFPERFAERTHLHLRKPGAVAPLREIVLESHWLHKDRIVLKFAGVDSMNDAELLRGLEVVIPREQRAPLDDDAAYIDDLVGCTLVDRNSGPVGAIVDVDRESTLGALLVLETGAGEALVPFVKAYEPVLDLAARTMTMTLPAGLLDVNATEPDTA
jgi:16S rRNA processing protein RimM